MNKLLLVFMIIISGCSSLKRTMLATGVVGGVIGGLGGATFSPNEESLAQNTYAFSILGAITGAGLTYLLREKSREAKVQKSLLLDSESSINKDIPLFDFAPELKGIKPEVSFKPVSKYEVPLEKLPKELEGKVKKQYIIEYEAKSRTLNAVSYTHLTLPTILLV